jgi:UDP-2,3-diacylglucosamine hydrolase
MAHGDGIGPGDFSYKLLKAIFTNKVLQFLFARLHPNFALWLGKAWSKRSRYAKGIVAEDFAGEEGELQIKFAKQRLEKKPADLFIFGHRHIPFDIEIKKNIRVVNLGDWIHSFTYGVLDDKNFALLQYQGDGKSIITRRL